MIDIGDCGVVVVESGRISACLKRPLSGQRLGDAAQNSIRFSIPRGEPDSSGEHWRYAVAVGGCAECGNRFADWVGEFLPVEEQASDQAGGGGSNEGNGSNIYDILSPTGRDQSHILSAQPVAVPLVGQ
ncbi:MAG: glucodextranase DOMON-like domain-containing protein [Candidatus Eisenbacteria bacterium]